MLNKLASEIKLEINSLQSKMRIANKDVEIKKDIFNNDYVSIKNREQSAYDPAFTPHIWSFLSDESSSYDDKSKSFFKTSKIFIGAFGSGKTSAICNKILLDAVTITKCDDNVRRSKIAIIRNTASQLETTTLETWLFWSFGLPTPRRRSKPQLTLDYTFSDGDGLIELSLIFLALDRADDVKKLDSLELTSAFINEGRHIPELIFKTLQQRVGRYPAKSLFKNSISEKDFDDCMPFSARIYIDTNPPRKTHWIQKLELANHQRIKVFHQPPALLKNDNNEWVINEDADNLKFITKQYYLDMIQNGDEFVNVYACGRYGTIVDGKAVYQNYNDELHSIEKIDIDKDEIIYLGVDYGTVCPAILISQFVRGQIRCIAEFIGDYLSIDSLYTSAVKPFLNQYCQDCKIVAIGDPADTYDGRAQLANHGIIVEPSRTNKVDDRINSVKDLLDRLINKKPRLLISRSGCSNLRDGFLGEYHYRRLSVVNAEKYVDYPDKTHPYSDIHDCLQYIAIKINDEEEIKKVGYDLYSDNNFNNINFENEKRSYITGY